MAAFSLATGARRPRLGALTSLRFFAASGVLLFHLHVSGLMPGAPPWLQAVAGVGYAGVSFFFVLSGFILVYTYGGRPLAARDFWQARFARVYPAYAASLLVALPMFAWMLIHMDFPFLAWIKQNLSLVCLMAASLMQAWVPQAACAWDAVGWSLSVEALFYLVFPVFFRVLSRLRARNLGLALLLGCCAAVLGPALYSWRSPDGVALTSPASENLFWLNVVRFNPVLRLPEFVAGMAAGFLYLKQQSWLAGKKGAFAATGLALGGTVGVIAVIAMPQQIPYPLLHSGLLTSLFTAMIFGVALRPAWAKALEAKPLVFLGEASYSLYLLHFTIIWAALIFWGRAAATPLGNLAVVLAAICASALSFLLVEMPARRALRNMRAARAAAAVA